VELRNTAGDLIYALECQQMPPNLWELVTQVKLALFDTMEWDKQTEFYATDGYAYTVEQFLAYYGEDTK
jgi:hypothetical protein